MTEKTPEELMAEAMLLVDQQQTPSEPASVTAQNGSSLALMDEEMDQSDQLRPTLRRLAESDRPKQRTACETCPFSLWLKTPVDVQCYCRVMHMVSWHSKKPLAIELCDGPSIPVN